MERGVQADSLFYASGEHRASSKDVQTIRKQYIFTTSKQYSNGSVVS